MDNDAAKRRHLFETWLAAHAAGHTAVLFTQTSAGLDLSPAASLLLQQHSRGESMCLYTVYLGELHHGPIPIYIGKSRHPWQRWRNGHLTHLRAAALGESTGAYTRWLVRLAATPTAPAILCIDEPQIRFPPLPGFPQTVGAVEYQLIALAQGAFPGSLLNSEGVER